MKIAGIVLMATMVLVLCVGLLSVNRGGVEAPETVTTVQSYTNANELKAASAPKLVRARPRAANSEKLLKRIINGDGFPRPTASELGVYVQSFNESSEALLGAFRATSDPSFLKRALEKFPHNPRVAFAAFYTNLRQNEKFSTSGPASADRREILERFKEGAPDNALPTYLSARDYFKSGQVDRAVEELRAAYNRPALNDYSLDYIQAAEEAYRAAGFPETEAKVVAACELPLPHLAELKQLAQDILNLSSKYRAAGDEASARAAVAYAQNLGERFSSEFSNGLLISQLVGIAMESQVLQAMDGSAPYGATGITAQQRLEALKRQREELKAVGKNSEKMMLRMTEQDLSTYFDRLKLQGEAAALAWAREKYGN